MAASGKTLVSDTPNHLNYCVIFVAYTQFTTWPPAALYNLTGCGLEETHNLVLDARIVLKSIVNE
jgi:hypothetical protein